MLRLKPQTKKYKTVNKLITKALIATINCYVMAFLITSMKKIFKLIFIGIPNIPLIIVLIIYVIYNIWKHTGIVEMHMQEDGDFLTKEIKDHIYKVFPKVLFRSIALCFWLYVILQAIT